MISVKDKLPEDTTSVLVSIIQHPYFLIGFYRPDVGWYRNGEGMDIAPIEDTVTYWQELPWGEM